MFGSASFCVPWVVNPRNSIGCQVSIARGSTYSLGSPNEPIKIRSRSMEINCWTLAFSDWIECVFGSSGIVSSKQ